jgi:hypothetical protein
VAVVQISVGVLPDGLVENDCSVWVAFEGGRHTEEEKGGERGAWRLVVPPAQDTAWGEDDDDGGRGVGHF